MNYNNLTLDEIVTNIRHQNHPLQPLNRKALQTLKNKKGLVGAEIGVSCGENAFDMLMKLSIKHLYLIDPYKEFMIWSQEKLDRHKEEAYSLLTHFMDKLEWIERPSRQAAPLIEDGELDFVYIDGDHTTTGCFRDIELYLPKVKIGGTVGGDNWEFMPVRKAVDMFMETRNEHLFTDFNLDTKCIDWWIIKCE